MSIRDNLGRFARQPVEKEVEGVKVFIRRMSLGEADALNEAEPNVPNGTKVSNSMRLLSRFLSDETGARIYDLSKADDIEALRSIPVQVAARLLELGNAVNAPPKEDAEKKA